MNNTDSLIKAEVKIQLDSLNQVYVRKIDSLSGLVNQYKISEGYFGEILSHQTYLLSFQTAIFSFIVFLLLGFAGFVSWQTFFKNISSRLNKLDKKILETPNLIADLNIVKYKALRALYEAATEKGWKVINNIRYLEWFVDNYDKKNTEDPNKQRIINQFKKLEKDYSMLKGSHEDYEWFKKFEHKGGLTRTLKKLLDSDIIEIRAITLELFTDLQ